jgi:hypothetical protein
VDCKEQLDRAQRDANYLMSVFQLLDDLAVALESACQ